MSTPICLNREGDWGFFFPSTVCFPSSDRSLFFMKLNIALVLFSHEDKTSNQLTAVQPLAKLNEGTMFNVSWLATLAAFFVCHLVATPVPAPPFSTVRGFMSFLMSLMPPLF